MLSGTPIYFERAWVLGLAVPLIILLVLIIRKNFVSLAGQQKKKRRIRQWLVLISRSLFLLAILVALASPHTVERTLAAGDPKITLLVDNSSSMQLYNLDFVPQLKQRLEQEVPVKVRYFGSSLATPLSDMVVQHSGQENILLVTDGNNYRGKALDDAMMVASTLNTTISAVELNPQKDDAAISIVGPSETVEDVTSDFVVSIDRLGLEEVPLKVTIDNEVVFDSVTDQEEITISKSFSRGNHRITAELTDDGYFQENNRFHKSVTTIKKPSILLVSSGPSHLQQILDRLYQTRVVSELPENLDQYFAVMLDNQPASKLSKPVVDQLSSYVINGSGVVWLGGRNSFEYGDYKNSYLETLLPVQIGALEKKPQDDVSAVILIDISASTKAKLAGEKGVDVEKAIALDIIEQMRTHTNLGVVAFNNKPHVVSRLSPLAGKVGMTDRIKQLQHGGGTFMNVGIRAAAGMLSTAPGSRNIIVISDGKTKRFHETVDLVKEALKVGIRTFTIDIGKETDTAKLKEIAKVGEGQYFKPEAAQSVSLLFGEGDQDQKTKPLMIRDRHHFITSNLNLTAAVSGFNQVVPKETGRVLASTVYGDPMLTISRLGLGRMAVFSTDNGNHWAGNLLNEKNSRLVSRTINWAIGNPNKKERYYARVPDTTLNQRTTITVKSPQVPSLEGVQFSKVGEDLYTAGYQPTELGFVKLLGTELAVNQPQEFRYIGFNPRLEELVESTGGQMFQEHEISKMIETAKSSAKVVKNRKIHYRTWFIFAGLAIILLEILIRRITAYKAKSS